MGIIMRKKLNKIGRQIINTSFSTSTILIGNRLIWTLSNQGVQVQINLLLISFVCLFVLAIVFMTCMQLRLNNRTYGIWYKWSRFVFFTQEAAVGSVDSSSNQVNWFKEMAENTGNTSGTVSTEYKISKDMA